MRAVGRIFATIIGFIAAVVAVAAFLLAAEVGVTPRDPAAAGVFWGQFAIYGAIAAAFVGAAVFVPWVVVALVTEIFAIRSVVVHVGGGGAIGVGAALLSGRIGGTASAATIGGLPHDLTLFTAAGFVGGFVYWLIAGRLAGIAPPARGPEETAAPR
jgi:hypothetical protein